MSVEAVIGQYVKLQEVKDANDFPDDLDDEELLTMIKEANQDIETKIVPYADKLPLTDGDPDFKAAGRAGLIYVRSLWKEKKHNFELADRLDKRYLRKIDDLIALLEAKPHDRTKALIIGNEPRDAKLPLPTQYSTFVFDDFP